MGESPYSPMLAVSGTPFDDERYLYEIKWDGIRAITCVDGARTTIYSRNGFDITFRYPELRFTGSVRQLPAVLDGEIVVLENGLPSFHALQLRNHFQDLGKIRNAVRNTPAIYMVFDLLQLGSEDLTALPLARRKELLNSAVIEGPHLVVSQYITGEGKAFFEVARNKGLEGVMAKRLDSPYYPGKRSSCWVKFRNTRTMSCVICGYQRGKGGRQRLGSLVLGVYDRGQLCYIGNVGSGLDEKEIDYLLAEFRVRDKSLFAAPPPLKDVVWVEAKLVCEVNYLEKREVLRHPTFLGLRQDISPAQCTLEQG